MKQTKKYEGLPVDVGGQIFNDHVMPFIRLASKAMSPKQLAELYGGFLGGALGSMTADFGPDMAIGIAQLTLQNSEKIIRDLHNGALQ